MDSKNIEKNWTELKAKIKTTWSKFTDDEIESVKTDLGLLVGKIEKVYGVAKEHAQTQYAEFTKSAQMLIQDNISSDQNKIKVSEKEAQLASTLSMNAKDTSSKTNPSAHK